jgi:hypothetical protein
MAALRPAIPVSVPAPVSTEAPSADVTASTVSDSTALDTQPDARQNPPGAATSDQKANQPLPTNRQASKKKQNSKPQPAN